MGGYYEGRFMMHVELERTEMCCNIDMPDMSIQCIHCGSRMNQEHSHYRCPDCGNRDACCEGVY